MHLLPPPSGLFEEDQLGQFEPSYLVWLRIVGDPSPVRTSSIPWFGLCRSRCEKCLGMGTSMKNLKGPGYARFRFFILAIPFFPLINCSLPNKTKQGVYSSIKLNGEDNPFTSEDKDITINDDEEQKPYFINQGRQRTTSYAFI